MPEQSSAPKTIPIPIPLLQAIVTHLQTQPTGDVAFAVVADMIGGILQAQEDAKLQPAVGLTPHDVSHLDA